MADENKPPEDPKEPQEPHQESPKKEEDKGDFKKDIQDKYNELKSHPKVKATRGMFSNHLFEIFYLVATVIAFIISLTRSGHGALIFIGIGFLVGLFLYTLIHNTSHKVGHFLTKQEMVVHIIIAIVLIILAFVIPTIMMGILVGIPAGFGVRNWINQINNQMGAGPKGPTE